MSNKVISSAKRIFCIGIIASVSSAYAGLIEVNSNLDDNLVPTGFTLETTNTSGLSNGRLEASATNGSGLLKYLLPTDDAKRIDISYTGSFGFSQWGTYTTVETIGIPLSFSHGINQYSHGNANFAAMTGLTAELSQMNQSIFDYTISLIDGTATFRVVDTSTNAEEFNLVYNSSDILVSNINQLSFRAHNTTGTTPVWLDDINIRIETVDVPEPAMTALILLGLCGMRFFRIPPNQTPA